MIKAGVWWARVIKLNVRAGKMGALGRSKYFLLWSVLLLVGVVTGAEEKYAWSNGTMKSPWRMHTLFSVECHVYFDWQTVGIMHSYRKSGQPGPITRLLSCTDEQLQSYKGMDLAPTLKVPSMSQHPVTGDWYHPSLSFSVFPNVAHFLKLRCVVPEGDAVAAAVIKSFRKSMCLNYKQ